MPHLMNVSGPFFGGRLALTTSEKALVLLKNERGLLPLSEAPKRIAVMGPNAHTHASLVGNYNGEPSHPVTVLDGIRRRFPDAEVAFEEGTGLIDPSLSLVPTEFLCLDDSCREKGLKADFFDNRTFENDPSTSSPRPQARYAWTGERKSGAVRWTGFISAPEDGEYTFRYEANGGYRIWVGGEQIVDAWLVDWRPSIATGKVTLEAGKLWGQSQVPESGDVWGSFAEITDPWSTS